MDIISIIFLVVAALIAVVGFLLRRSAQSKLRAAEHPGKGAFVLKTLGSILMVVGIWRFLVRLLSLISGTAPQTGNHRSVFTQEIAIGQLHVSATTVLFLGIVLVLILLAVVLRLVVVPHMREKPKNMQSALESFVSSLSNCMNARVSFLITVVIFCMLALATIIIGISASTDSLAWNFVAFLLAVLVAIAGFSLRRSAGHALERLAAAEETPQKGVKRAKTWGSILMIVGIWTIVVRLLPMVFGQAESESLSVNIWADRVQLGSLNLSTTILLTWIVMAVLIVLALVIRIAVIPRMKEQPKGIQAVLEIAVEAASGYTKDKTGGSLGNVLGSYIFTVAVFMVGCAIAELFGVRAPTSDLTLTFALALITFVLINYYGLKKKGLSGRIKSLASPSPMVFPLRIISDIAVPVSLACRLFGNMLGGMIVMDLLYSALGSSAVGIPSIIGLYFNVFHPLIQAFIFITLSLTFINEAVE